MANEVDFNGRRITWNNNKGEQSFGNYLGIAYGGNIDSGMKTYVLAVRSTDSQIVRIPTHKKIHFTNDDT